MKKPSIEIIKRIPGGLVTVILLFAVAGIIILLRSYAATPSVSLEPEDGSISGSAAKISDATASGAAALKFGTEVRPDTPLGLHAVTGGNSVALMWDPSKGTIPAVSYKIFRGGVQIGTATPNTAVPAYADGSRYIDAQAKPGTKYSYQVQAVAADGKVSAQSSSLSVSVPTATTPVPTVTVDTSLAPDLAGYFQSVVVPELQIWYPKISDKIAFPSYAPAKDITIRIVPGLTNIGEAYADQSLIQFQAEYVRSHPEDLRMYMHEATHVIQHSAAGTPSWIQEGTADWAAKYFYLPKNDPLPSGYYDIYTAGYSTAAYLLNWIQSHNNPTFIRDLNIAVHNGTYTRSYITTKTGKSEDQHWTDMTGHAVKSGPITSRSVAKKCLDVASSNRASGTKIQNWTCNGSDAQYWSKFTRTDGTVELLAFGSCLDVKASGTTDGTLVQLWGCNGTAAQRWRINTNGTLLNINSNKCLYDSGGVTDGIQLTIKTCDVSDPGQLWNSP